MPAKNKHSKKTVAKTKGIIAEFKKFIMKGNVLDLAVGIIIGGAFQVIVNSLVVDVIMPVITLITGGLDFTNWFISLSGKQFATLEQARAESAATLNYGVFITAFINFIIMALVIFFLVKVINRLQKPLKSQPEPTTKTCPYCKSKISIEAVRCAFCTSELGDSDMENSGDE